MRLVRLISSLAVRDGLLMAGSLYPCPDAIAEYLVSSGHAESVTRECMQVDPMEVAIPPRVLPRRRGSRSEVS